MFLTVVLAVALVGGGATLAAATGGGGWHHGHGSAHVQYKKKKLCKSTWNNASNRSRHIGKCFNKWPDCDSRHSNRNTHKSSHRYSKASKNRSERDDCPRWR